MTNVDNDTGVLAGEQRMLIDGELRYTDSGRCSTSCTRPPSRSPARPPTER